jgi:tetratricopeptide (TPR) repeat protein
MYHWIQEGQELLIQHEYASALPLFQKAQSLIPEDPLPYYWIGEAHFYLKQKEKAQSAFQTCLSKEPPPRFKQKCDERLALFQPPPSSTTPPPPLNNQIHTPPPSYETQVQKGFQKEDAPQEPLDPSQEELARQEFDLAVRLEEQWIHEGKKEDYEKTLHHYQQAITLYHLPEAYLHKARLLLENETDTPEKQKEAIHALQTVIELYAYQLKEETLNDPTRSETWQNLGMVYRLLANLFGKEKAKLARKAYRKSIQYHERNHESHYFLGCVYQDYFQNFKKAIESFQKALEYANSSSTRARYANHLAWILATEKEVLNPPLAIQLAEEAVRLEPLHHNLDTLAQSYYAHGQYTQALQKLEEALKKCEFPEDKQAYTQKLKQWKKQLPH